MKSAVEPSDHTITLPDGSTQTYHLRSLQHDTEDITKWTEFCSSVFSYKSNPPSPSYFARHYYNDPRSDATLIRVLIHCPNNTSDERRHGEIVSSVRIFRRSLSIAGQQSNNSSSSSIEAGGIGEVCTSPNHQRRGLSKLLLKDALNIMSSSDSGMKCSLLHASPDFRPVYSKVGGYESVTSNWSIVPIQLQHLSTQKSGSSSSSNSDDIKGCWSIRQARFPQDAKQLYKLHHEYSEQRFITIVRSLQYWEEYVSAELDDTLWVLTSSSKNDDTIIAWMSIRRRGEDRYQLREFGMDKSSTSAPQTLFALKHLLGVALDQLGITDIGTSVVESENDSEKKLVLPTFVLSDIKQELATSTILTESFLDWKNAKEENDEGWMYVDFDRDSSSSQQCCVLEMTTRDVDPIFHLIWPTDSF